MALTFRKIKSETHAAGKLPAAWVNIIYYLRIYDFCIYNFYYSLSDIVHMSYPFHLAICFKLLSNSFLLCHLCRKLKKHILGLLVDFDQVAVQLT